MRMNEWMKRFLLVFMAASLVLALAPAVTFAQEGEGENTATEEEIAAAEETVEEIEGAGEEEGGLLTPLGINAGLLITHLLNFALLAFIMTRFIWSPAVNMLDERSQTIRKGLEDAAAASKARMNAEEEAEGILAEARQERQRILEEARAAAEDVQKGIETDARQEAERIRNEGQQSAEAARNNALADMRDQVVAISSAVAGRVLEAEIDQNKQRELVSDFFTKVPESAKNLSGQVEIVSAMPLDDSEKQRVESEINADSYTYTVDPNILGGLIVRSQDRVIDGSVLGSLNDVTDRLR